MKKIIAFVLICIIIFATVGCVKDADVSGDITNGKETVTSETTVENEETTNDLSVTVEPATENNEPEQKPADDETTNETTEKHPEDITIDNNKKEPVVSTTTSTTSEQKETVIVYVPSDPIIVEKEVTVEVEKIVEKPVEVVKEVVVEKPIYIYKKYDSVAHAIYELLLNGDIADGTKIESVVFYKDLGEYNGKGIYNFGKVNSENIKTHYSNTFYINSKSFYFNVSLPTNYSREYVANITIHKNAFECDYWISVDEYGSVISDCVTNFDDNINR